MGGFSHHDAHHLIHHRREWESRPQSKYIRDLPALVPRIPREVHNEIHANVPPVPLLGYHALLRVASEMQDYRRNPNTLDTLDGLKSAIENAGKHPRAHDIERQLSGLAIAALELQEPYLREAL